MLMVNKVHNYRTFYNKQFNHFKVFFFNFLNNKCDLTLLKPSVYKEYKELIQFNNSYDIIEEIDLLSNKNTYNYFKLIFDKCFFNKLYRTIV